MRSSWKSLVAVAGLLVAPQLAAADDVQEQLELMQERMGQLEDQIQVQSDELEDAQKKVEDQQGLIESAGLGEEQASSGLSSFLQDTEFGAWV